MNVVIVLVRDVCVELTADDTVPKRRVLFVEFVLDVSGDVSFNAIFLQRPRCTIDRILQSDEDVSQSRRIISLVPIASHRSFARPQ